MSLRIKFMLALLLTGLASVVLIGGLAYARVYYKVDSLRRQQAAQHFHSGVTAYLTEYGDWKSGNAAQPFMRFMQARRDPMGPPGAPPFDAGPGSAGRGDGAPPRGRPPAPDGARPPQSGPERNHPRGPGAPPFHFILTDQNYVVLLGAGAYPDGQPLPQAARGDALPVLVGQRTVAYVSTQGVLTPSRQELEYLAAVRDALLLGAASATALALGLGLLLGTGLSRSLSRLTAAVRAMQAGSLRQQVPVQGRDEVAALATAFNQMSEELAHSHDELHASHATILRQAEQLRELSVRDALTELHNRRHFDQHATTLFQQALRHQRPLSVVIGDIDFFKRINDRFSHATGDAVLRQIGVILRGHMRLSDLVARYGGEEFVIALPETNLPQAAALCDKLRTLIEQFPWHQVHPELTVTMSIGVCADLTAGSAEAMLRQADARLYEAKRNGRNRVCCAA